MKLFGCIIKKKELKKLTLIGNTEVKGKQRVTIKLFTYTTDKKKWENPASL